MSEKNTDGSRRLPVTESSHCGYLGKCPHLRPPGVPSAEAVRENVEQPGLPEPDRVTHSEAQAPEDVSLAAGAGAVGSAVEAPAVIMVPLPLPVMAGARF